MEVPRYDILARATRTLTRTLRGQTGAYAGTIYMSTYARAYAPKQGGHTAAYTPCDASGERSRPSCDQRKSPHGMWKDSPEGL